MPREREAVARRWRCWAHTLCAGETPTRFSADRCHSDQSPQLCLQQLKTVGGEGWRGDQGQACSAEVTRALPSSSLPLTSSLPPPQPQSQMHQQPPMGWRRGARVKAGHAGQGWEAGGGEGAPPHPVWGLCHKGAPAPLYSSEALPPPLPWAPLT